LEIPGQWGKNWNDNSRNPERDGIHFMKIKDKVALVLGAARGIGREIGLALAGAGAKVVLTCFDWPEDAHAMQEEFARRGHDFLAVQADLRDPSQMEDLFTQISERYGRLDILINNIERGGMPVVHGSYARPANRSQWDIELETTLKAKWLAVHHAMPLLKKNNEGVVITLSSIAGLVGRSGPAALLFNDGYAAANRGVSSFTETWAREGAPGVRVNELMLGFFETRHTEKTRGWELLSGKEKKALLDHILLARTGRLDDIVKAVFFLIEDAAYMTGGTIRLDGGYVLGGEQVPPMPAGILQDVE